MNLLNRVGDYGSENDHEIQHIICATTKRALVQDQTVCDDLCLVTRKSRIPVIRSVKWRKIG